MLLRDPLATVFRNPQGLEKHLTGHIANLPDFRFRGSSTRLKRNSGVMSLPYSSTPNLNAARSVAPFNAGFVPHIHWCKKMRTIRPNKALPLQP